MKIYLPLTLAIIDGFMVKVGELFYVVPLDVVVECTEVELSTIDIDDGSDYINLRGEMLPFIRLRDFFKEEPDDLSSSKIIIVEHHGKKVGFVIDELIGKFQTVIKPLGRIYKNLQWVSGLTILGTGEIAYILDVPNLIKEVNLKSK